jgi:outer membrane lipoprotein-sorting protein
VAATVLIAFVGLVFWLLPGSGVALAFADVAEALTNVRTATWKTTSVAKGPQNETDTANEVWMFLAPSHERMERTLRGNQEIGIFDGRKDKAIGLNPAARTATVMDLKNLPPENPLGRSFQGLQRLVADARSGTAGTVERLGVETIDGRRAEGFRIRHGALEVKVWADPKTLLPIRVEEARSAAPEDRIVMTDFQVGVDLDESLFSLDVPAGYTVQTIQVDLSKKPIAVLAETLKFAAEHNDGVFPPTLLGEPGLGDIMRRAATAVEKKHGKDSPEMLKLGSDLAMKMAATFAILSRLSPENDWHYVGKDVKLNMPNRPIFWFKPKKSTSYQVIYADLSVKEVPAEEAPKVPQSEGSPKP